MLLLTLLLLQAPSITLLRAADAVAPVRIERIELGHHDRHVVRANETVILYALDGSATRGEAFAQDDALYSSGTSLTLTADKSLTLVRFTLERATPKKRKLLKHTQALPAYAIAAKKGSARIVFEPSETDEPSWVFDCLDVQAGANVPEHKHQDAVEIVLVVRGEAATVVDGTGKNDALVTIPKGALHSATFPIETRALQLYTPAGPEQRFRQGGAAVPK